MTRRKLPLVPRSLRSVSQTPPNTAEVMERPCEAHAAAAGESCYGQSNAVCSDRVTRWLARSSAEAPTIPAELPTAPRPGPSPSESRQAAEGQHSGGKPRSRRPVLPRTRITSADVRSSQPVDLSKLSPLERRAAEVRAAQRAEAENRRRPNPHVEAQVEAVRRERQARAQAHWQAIQDQHDDHDHDDTTPEN